MKSMNKLVEGVLGQSNVELIKYLDSIHARLEKMNEQMDTLIELTRKVNGTDDRQQTTDSNERPNL